MAILDPNDEVRAFGNALAGPRLAAVRVCAPETLEGGSCSGGYLSDVVAVAAGGHEALDLYCAKGATFDLVLLNLSVPDMGGECFTALKQLAPDIWVLVCTGHGNSADTEAMVQEGTLDVIRKPFDVADLRRSVEEAFAGQRPDRWSWCLNACSLGDGKT